MPEGLGQHGGREPAIEEDGRLGRQALRKPLQDERLPRPREDRLQRLQKPEEIRQAHHEAARIPGLHGEEIPEL